MKNSLGDRPGGLPAPGKPEVVVIGVLSQAQYRRLEEHLPAIDPRTADPVQAGIALGMQYVLRVLRTGFVTGG